MALSFANPVLTFDAISTTQAVYLAQGGHYQFVWTSPSWSSNTATFSVLAGDGSTYVSVITATANSYADVYLAAGTYSLIPGSIASLSVVITLVSA